LIVRFLFIISNGFVFVLVCGYLFVRGCACALHTQVFTDIDHLDPPLLAEHMMSTRQQLTAYIQSFAVRLQAGGGQSRGVMEGGPSAKLLE
jgi:hypothetical protein